MKQRRTRGDMAINWIETHCRVPSGPRKGKPVVLYAADRITIRAIYDAPDGVPPGQHIAGDLAAYLALLHTCGPEAADKEVCPAELLTDPWTVWNAADSPSLRTFLKREADGVACPQLGTKFPAAA